MARKVVGSLYLVSALQNELDRAFARAGEIAEGSGQGADLAPPIDVIENDHAVIIVLEVPGLKSEDLTVETSGNLLEIKGRRPAIAPEGGPIRFFCMECSHGDFHRSVELVGALDTHRARARLAKGLLRVEIPKITDRRLEPLRIEIESEDRA